MRFSSYVYTMAIILYSQDSPLADSNRPPAVYKAAALPTELKGQLRVPDSNRREAGMIRRWGQLQ